MFLTLKTGKIIRMIIREKVTAINESLFLFNKPSKIMASDSSVVKSFNHVLVIIRKFISRSYPLNVMLWEAFLSLQNKEEAITTFDLTLSKSK